MKKQLIRRSVRDRSRQWRLGVQVSFLTLNLWIGLQFYLWARYYETGGRSLRVARPGGIEGWLPIAALMNLKFLIGTGHVQGSHAAGMFILIAFLLISVLLRKAFCGWLCPVGTGSEALWRMGRHIFGRNFTVPRWLDLPLRSLKYILLGLFLYAVGSMSAGAISAFLQGPYGIVADVKMLNFFRHLSLTAAVVLSVLILASVLVQNFWCRYLCPYGALMGLVSLLSPVRIRRNEPDCIDCGKCAKACAAVLRVDKLVQIRSAECTSCMACVAACPAENALGLQLHTPKRRVAIPAWALVVAVFLIFTGVCGYAKYINLWDSRVPEQVYFDLVPNANDLSHP